MRLPSVLDAQDRRIVGSVVVVTVAVVLLVLMVAVAAGLAVRVFMLTSGLGG